MIHVDVFSEYGDMPEYAHDGDSGVDAYAHAFQFFDITTDKLSTDIVKGDIILEPGERILVHTGWHFGLNKGTECQIRPRSGLALKKGITVLNSPGTGDAIYTGEYCVILINHSGVMQTIEINSRIAQFVFTPVEKAMFVKKEALVDLQSTTRGENGFGSTGTKAKGKI